MNNANAVAAADRLSADEALTTWRQLIVDLNRSDAQLLRQQGRVNVAHQDVVAEEQARLDEITRTRANLSAQLAELEERTPQNVTTAIQRELAAMVAVGIDDRTGEVNEQTGNERILEDYLHQRRANDMLYLQRCAGDRGTDEGKEPVQLSNGESLRRLRAYRLPGTAFTVAHERGAQLIWNNYVAEARIARGGVLDEQTAQSVGRVAFATALEVLNTETQRNRDGIREIIEQADEEVLAQNDTEEIIWGELMRLTVLTNGSLGIPGAWQCRQAARGELDVVQQTHDMLNGLPRRRGFIAPAVTDPKYRQAASPQARTHRTYVSLWGDLLFGPGDNSQTDELLRRRRELGLALDVRPGDVLRERLGLPNPLQLWPRMVEVRPATERTGNEIIDFFNCGVPFHRHYFTDLLVASRDNLESWHDFIQITFPLPERSAHLVDAPLMTQEVFMAFRTNARLLDHMRRFFEVMLDFYGFRMRRGVAENGDWDIEVRCLLPCCRLG